MFKCKEDVLIYFLGNKLQLSRYDHKFVTNLFMLIERNKKITSNQSNLFDKLLTKYQKQLSKKGIITKELLEIKWEVEVHPSSIEYTGSKVSLQDGFITVNVPFNKKFISALKNQKYYNWDNTSKKYKAVFTTKALKYILLLLPTFFENVSLCETLKELLKKIDEYNNSNLIWNPTYKRIGDLFLLAGTNETLNELTKNIKYSDDPKLLFHLSSMGIDIDDSVIQNDPAKKFAGTFINFIDLDELGSVNNFLPNIGVNEIFVARSVMRNNIRFDIKELLNNIQISPIHDLTEQKNAVILHYGLINFDADLLFYRKRVSKIILITNSRPINIK